MSAPASTYAYMRRLLRSHRVELRIAVDLLADHGLTDEFEELVDDETGNTPHWLGMCPHMDEPDSAPDPEVALRLEVQGLRAEAADQRAFILAIQTLVARPAPQPWGTAERTIFYYGHVLSIAERVLAERFDHFKARVQDETGISFWCHAHNENLVLRPGRRYLWSNVTCRKVILFYRDMMTILIDVLADRAQAFYARVDAETGHPFRGDHVSLRSCVPKPPFPVCLNLDPL